MDDRQEFESWKRRVDNELLKLSGMISDDLPDADYWSMFENGDTPKQAAKYVIRHAMSY